MFVLHIHFLIMAGLAGILSLELEYQKTSFTCHGRAPGYYPDTETGCKTYHVCDGQSHFTYICPLRTLFHKKKRICDHSYMVKCKEFILENDEQDDEDVLFGDGGNSEKDGKNDFVTSDSNTISTLKTNVLTTALSADDATNIDADIPATTPSIMTPTNENTENITETFFDSTNSDLQTSLTTSKVLKLNLRDFRSLFYIPEVEGNAVVTENKKEVILFVEKNDLMKFLYRSKKNDSEFPCPSHCDPKYFDSNTCHPCILIK